MKQTTVELDNCTAIVRELTVRDVKKIISNMKDLFGAEDIEIKDLITERMDSLIDLTGNVIEFSDGKEFLDLTFSEIEKLLPVVLEVNSSFLGQLAALGILPAPEQALENLVTES
jgi:hypothetical protein